MTPNSSQTIAALILENLKADPERLFLSDETGSLTGGAFTKMVAARKSQLLHHGVGGEDKVLVSGGRGLQFWVDMIAVWGVGGVFVPLGSDLQEDHLLFICETIGAKVALCSESHDRHLPEDVIRLPKPGTGGGALSIDARWGELVAICFTSGSTGTPKGVALSHQALTGNAQATLETIRPASDDHLFFAIPFNFISAISHFLVASLAGMSVHATEKLSFYADLYKAIDACGATCFGGSPIQIRWLVECAKKSPLPLDWIMSSGDHLPTKDIALLSERMPLTKLFVVYGLTEVGGRFCILPPDCLDAHAGSVGYPIPGMSIDIRDDAMKTLAPRKTGQVFARGDFLCKAYYENPTATKESLSEFGFKTGDLGYRDEEGFLYLVGRSDDVFKVAGQKVSTVAVAEALMEFGCFADVAVAPVSHPLVEHVPHAFYVLKSGESFSKGKTLRFLRGRLPASSIPQGFTEVDAIPRTGSGKVKRGELAKLLPT